MLKKAVQQGRSERRAETYPRGYVEGLSDARTMLAGFFSILLGFQLLLRTGRRSWELLHNQSSHTDDIVQIEQRNM